MRGEGRPEPASQAVPHSPGQSQSQHHSQMQRRSQNQSQVQYQVTRAANGWAHSDQSATGACHIHMFTHTYKHM